MSSKRYSAAYKQLVVDKVMSEASVTSVHRQTKVNVSSIRKWVLVPS